jgi:hypothetical protein
MENELDKQTAVEWLMEEMSKTYIFNQDDFDMFKQAKELTQKQEQSLSAAWAKSREQTRETAMHVGFAKGFMSGLECYEDYYSELENTDLDEDEFTRNYIVDIFEQTYGGKNGE